MQTFNSYGTSVNHASQHASLTAYIYKTDQLHSFILRSAISTTLTDVPQAPVYQGLETAVVSVLALHVLYTSEVLAGNCSWSRISETTDVLDAS